MMRNTCLAIALVMVAFASSAGAAGDFGWMRDFNIRAAADPLDFRARLEARFKIGELEINAVFGHADDPADRYMLFRLGEIGGQPIERVIECYEAEKGKGWGVIAKRLGIKPGSAEFHALKRSQDLYDDNGGGKVKDKQKSKKQKS